MIDFIKGLELNTLVVAGVTLFGGYVMLLIARLVIAPSRQRKRAQEDALKRTQKIALRRMNEIRTAENDRTDVWSRTCSRDTISKAIDPAFQRKLERTFGNID